MVVRQRQSIAVASSEHSVNFGCAVAFAVAFVAVFVRDANDEIAFLVFDVRRQRFVAEVLASIGFVPLVFERIDGF